MSRPDRGLIANLTPGRAAGCRLLLLPPAGAGVTIWHRLGPALRHEDFEVLALRLPGREVRFSEPNYEHIDDLLSDVIAQLPDDRCPLILFGHSLGGLASFGLADALMRAGRPEPRHVFISGRMAPSAIRPRRAHLAPPAEFANIVRKLGGTPEEVFTNPELWAIYAKCLRADFGLAESWPSTRGGVIRSPITVLGGRHDPTTQPEGLAAWSAHTSGPTEVHLYDGGHFFLFERVAEVLALIRTAAREITVASE